jgi:hypothetical protein
MRRTCKPAGGQEKRERVCVKDGRITSCLAHIHALLESMACGRPGMKREFPMIAPVRPSRSVPAVLRSFILARHEHIAVTCDSMTIRSRIQSFMLLCILATLAASPVAAQEGVASGAVHEGSRLVIARIKYGGGGDWYNDPSSEFNLLRFIKEQTAIDVDVKSEEFVDVGSEKLFSYPIAFLTGHGNILFTQREAANLRRYLENGGFLYVDDDYGLDAAFRREIRKVFPEKDLTELPFDHPIYHAHFSFPSGLPKIHEHDGKPPQGFGILHNGRLVLFYTYECNLADGWADAEVHKDPEPVRRRSLEMGTNIIVYALTH